MACLDALDSYARGDVTPRGRNCREVVSAESVRRESDRKEALELWRKYPPKVPTDFVVDLSIGEEYVGQKAPAPVAWLPTMPKALPAPSTYREAA